MAYDIQILFISYITLAAVLAMVYGLRRVFLLEKKIARLEQAILRLEKKLLKKR